MGNLEMAGNKTPDLEDQLSPEHYEQPEKVDKIEALPSHTSVDEFVGVLRRDVKKKVYRGYHKRVEPLPFHTPKPADHTRFVCISDTHNLHDEIDIPDGDVLLHAGDFTDLGKVEEVDRFNEWLGKLPHKHKVVIAGNHELSFDRDIMKRAMIACKNEQYIRFNFLKNIPEHVWMNWKSRMTNCIYLEDEKVTINGINIYGSPWQPEFCALGFNLNRGREILDKWDKIPDDTDILMTHGPPAGRLDMVSYGGMHVGCIELLNTVQLRVQPKYHLFGHIHETPGYETDLWTNYINASMVTKSYQATRKPIIFDFPNPPNATEGLVTYDNTNTIVSPES